jgi:two-component system LytT family response regulator
MENIRTLIADDELPAQRRLLDLLAKEPDIQVAGVARDGREAVELVSAHRPDLLFLDVQMPVLDGFGALRQLEPQMIPVTVFVTAYDKYAIRAFEAHALDYLLKPYSDERFETTLQRARDHIRTHRASELGQCVARLLAGPAPAQRDLRPPYLERVAIKASGRVTFLNVGEIDWIEAAGVYVNLHCGGRTCLLRETLAQLLKRLEPNRFVRIHRSAAVNTARICELRTRSHGDYSVLLKDGTTLALSRNYRAQLEAWLRQSI